MKTNLAIIQVFSSNPEKWLNMTKVKSLVSQLLVGLPTDFEDQFRALRDSKLEVDGKRFVKFWIGSFGWRYSLTDKKGLIANHNCQQSKIKRRADERIIR
jgi:hypothetical protein